MNSILNKRCILTLFLFIQAFGMVAIKWYVYPSSYTLGNGSGTSKVNAFKGLQNINWNVINPGDTVLLLADKGYFSPYPADYLRPTKSGTAALPILITREVGASPVLDTSLVLFENNIKHIRLDGITIRRSPYAGITLRNGAANIIIKNCTIKKCWQGFDFIDSVGDSIIVENCLVDSNSTNGVGIRDSCSTIKPNIIRGCTITNNGHHGIELNANYYIIESNSLNKNGRTMGGTSAIHLLGGPNPLTPDGYGHYNTIRYNLCRNQMEPGLNAPATDGNGIQLDQFCSHNKVYYNICLDNDCAGIAVYDSRLNEIYNNTLLGNNKNSFGNLNPPLADLSVTSTTSLYNLNLYSYGNIIKNNLIVSYNNAFNHHAIKLDDKSSLGNNVFSKNCVWNTTGSNTIWRYVNQTGNSEALWNSNANATDFVTLPFVLPANPNTAADTKISCSAFAYLNGENVGLTRDYFGNIISGIPSIGAHQGNVIDPLIPTNTTPTNNQSICENNSTLLSAISSTNILNWYASPTSTTILSSGTTYSTSQLTTGTYTYYVSATNACTVSLRTPITISVNPNPLVVISNGTVCSGSSYTLNPSGANSYTYSSGTAIVTPISNTTYSIVGTSLQGCASSNTALCTINVKSTPTVNVVSSSTLICLGQTANLTASGANTYSWSNGSTTAGISVSPTITSTYSVTGTKVNGCSSMSIITQSVSSCTGVFNTMENDIKNVVFYPNPSSKELNVDLNNSLIIYLDIKIINALGETVLFEEKWSYKTHPLNIENLPVGIYTISVKEQEGNSSKCFKLIKN